ncbi:hypothetical protein PoB_006921300 [Plakobranchus ocellatus]|uniref:MD-2-related lipid-recognition domain-containing protein n=1 Tax=Plakobranchus ocellatus TaxID=259542 RepID=A0AAV4DEL3_9GAST|nr:hypothetical protein PoB_006921300 [Plakobranchus ocellatus]
MIADSGMTCNGQPCACPLTPGTYTFNNLQISTGDLHPLIARVARNTRFYVKVRFYNKNSNHLLSCLSTELVTRGR